MAIKVSQAVIDEIKKKGMSSSIAHANSGNATTEFTEGARRMYGNRVKTTGSEANKKEEAKVSNRTVPSVGDKDSGSSKSKEVKMPPSAPAAAARKSEKKSTAQKALGTSNTAFVNRNVGKPLSKLTTSLAAKKASNLDSVGKALGGAKKKLGINNPLKPRKR